MIRIPGSTNLSGRGTVDMDKQKQLPEHIQKALKLIEFAGDNNNALQAGAGASALTAAMIAQKRNSAFNAAQQNAYNEALRSAVDNRPNPLGVQRSMLEAWTKNDNPSLRNPPPMRELPWWIHKATQYGKGALAGSIPYVGPFINAATGGAGAKVAAAIGLLATLAAPTGGSRRPDGTVGQDAERDPLLNRDEQGRIDWIWNAYNDNKPDYSARFKDKKKRDDWIKSILEDMGYMQ